MVHGDAAGAGANHPATAMAMLFLVRAFLWRFLGRRFAFRFGLGTGRDGRQPHAFAVTPLRFHRAAFRDAFAVDVFEQVGLAGHDDLTVAEASPLDGHFAALAILRVGPDAGPPIRIGARRHDVEAGWAQA